MDELLAFGVEHVRRITGLSRRQLTYWDKTRFFSPSLAEHNRSRPFSRIYTFRDVVGLKTLGLLRREHEISLQELRKVGAWLRKHHDTPWSALRFYVGGKRVYFDDPRTGQRVGSRPVGQPVFPIAMAEIAHEVRSAALNLRERSSSDVGKVVQHRYVVHNLPTLAGTRIPTAAVWDLHQASYSVEEIIKEYPRLTPDDVSAAVQFEKQRSARKRAS